MGDISRTIPPIRKVAVIGAGLSGRPSGPELALLSARAGFLTVLEDVLPGNLRWAAAMLGSAPKILGLRYATSIEDAVRDADLVIDTVPDELESKLEILSLLDRMAPPHTLFATPTETLSIADLASCTYRPGQCFGVRFLSGVPLTITLSHAPVCLPATLERARCFFQAVGVVIATAEDMHSLP